MENSLDSKAQAALFDNLRELVSINSENPFRTVQDGGHEFGIGNETAIQRVLEKKLAAAGFRVERQSVQEKSVATVNGMPVEIPERFNLLAEKGSGDKSLLLFAHVDTVDVKSGWKHNPFKLTEFAADGRKCFSGLGSNDMKAGIAAMLFAGEVDPPDGWKVKIALLVDEEFWSFGACTMLQSSFLNDVKLAICPELPESGSSPDIQWIGIGRLGRTEFVFDVEGQACHGADAFVNKKAVNAAHEVAKLAVALHEYSESVRKEFSAEGISAMNSAYVNYLQGGKGILSVPDKGSCVLDRSLVPGENEEGELQKIEAFLTKVKVEKRIDPRATVHISRRPRPTPINKPYFLSPSSPAVQFVSRVAKSIAGEIEYGIGRTVADENRLADAGVPVVIIPPHGSGAHTCEEWVDAESVVRIAAIMRLAIEELNSF